MKKYLFIFAAVALFASCSKELQNDKVNNVPEQPGLVTVSFDAVVEDIVDAETKAAISTSGDFSWTDGDVIAVQLEDDTFAPFTYSSSTKKFTASLSKAIKDGGVAYYPSTIAISGTPGSVALPASYTAAAAASGFPMIASVSLGATTLSFTHLGGILSLRASHVPADATKLVLTVPGVGVTGTFAVGSGKISAGASNSEVELTFDAGAYGTSGAEFFIPVPETSFSGGFTMAFKNASSEDLFTKTTSKTTITVDRATMTRMHSLTVPRYIYLNTSNPWDGIVTTSLYMYSATANNTWPGASASGSFTHNSGSYTRYIVPEEMVGQNVTVLFNGGNVTADGGYGVEDFTRIQGGITSLNTDVYCSINTVSQSKTRIYFRDNNGQQYDWEYNLYGWNRDNESQKLFGNWNGAGKSNNTYFSWSAVHDEVWYGMFEVDKNFKLGLIVLNPNGNNDKYSQTNNINIDCTESNYVVVTDNASGDPKIVAGFPTVSLDIE